MSSTALAPHELEFARRLSGYLASKLPSARNLRVERVERFTTGASKQTWSADARWQEGGAEVTRGFVVRTSPPKAGPLDTDAGVEFTCYQKLQGRAIPIPEMLWLEEDSRSLGAPFYVMSRIENATADLRALAAPEQEGMRRRLSDQLGTILASLHTLDPAPFDFLGSAPAPDRAASGEVQFWLNVMRQEQLEPQPGLEAAFLWLKRHLPAPAQRTVVVHGDFRTGNFLWNEHGIQAMLDWEMVHLGDPMEDVGWLRMMSWGGPIGAGLVPWQEFEQRYTALSGVHVDPAELRFWEVFSHVKLSVILKTGGWRFRRGQADDILQGQLEATSFGPELRALQIIGTE